MKAEIVTNPLDNPVIIPVITVLTLLFSLGGMALALVSLRQKQLEVTGGGTIAAGRTPRHVLWQRYRTWLIIAFVYGGAALCGALTTAAMVAFIIWQGIAEYAKLFSLPKMHQYLAVLCGWLTLILVLVGGSTEIVIAPAIAFFFWAFVALLPLKGEHELKERFMAASSGFSAYLYAGWLPAHLLALETGQRPGLTLAIGLGVALSDIGAFCGGKTLRGPKLSPKLSPNKTWGGVVGNLMGAGIAIALFSFALTGMAWWLLFLLSLGIAVGSVCGDLFESLLKRQSGVKDAGNFLPGFGGLLDRIDSLLFVAPLVFYLSRLETLIGL
ncbi:phosphatidate cytidylyltransferase [Candidatus Chlorohelix sp.]|uniref:phosphatidate cytidylyltransferase n=1 Tax=Candidatus Chlorohelix sp. TaxID=3139201 RepID=UPI00306F7E7F